MATSRSALGKSSTFTFNTPKVLNEDVLFSVPQDFDSMAILCPSRGL